MTRREPTPTPPVLLWSQQGCVCCPKHAPYPGSDTWRNDRWRRMRDLDIAAFAAESGLPVECEVCGPMALARRARARR
jgi:hypothetical protein